MQLVAPFAPHMAEELWEQLGHATSLFEEPAWPTFDPARATSDEVELVVQVNGKVRGKLVVARGLDEESALTAARGDDNVARFIEGKSVRKVIYVADRLNVVVG